MEREDPKPERVDDPKPGREGKGMGREGESGQRQEPGPGPGSGPGPGLGRRRRRDRWRLVPPAITPLTFADLGAGAIGHLRGAGRDRFRRDVESALDADGSATYTSFRRALAGCFDELLDTAGRDRRDVLVPIFCSADFADAIEGVGLDPVRYDVDPETLSVDLASLESGLGPDTLAVVAVNVLGFGSPMDAVADRCRDRGVFLVEALGYALGTEYEDRPLGTFGDCAVLNFQQGKPIPIGGGMVVSQDPALVFEDEGRPAVDPNLSALAGYAALSHPRPYYAYSRLKDFLDAVGVSTGRDTTHPESKFEVEYAPPFATISDFQGAIAHRVFQRLPDHRRHRERTARFYAEALSDSPGVERVEPVTGLSKHQYVRFPLIAATESLRDRIRLALEAVGVQATTLYDWPVIDPDAFPGGARLQRGIVTLPTHPYVDERDRRIVVDTIRAVAETDDSGSR